MHTLMTLDRLLTTTPELDALPDCSDMEQSSALPGEPPFVDPNELFALYAPILNSTPYKLLKRRLYNLTSTCTHLYIATLGTLTTEAMTQAVLHSNDQRAQHCYIQLCCCLKPELRRQLLDLILARPKRQHYALTYQLMDLQHRLNFRTKIRSPLAHYISGLQVKYPCITNIHASILYYEQKYRQNFPEVEAGMLTKLLPRERVDEVLCSTVNLFYSYNQQEDLSALLIDCLKEAEELCMNAKTFIKVLRGHLRLPFWVPGLESRFDVKVDCLFSLLVDSLLMVKLSSAFVYLTAVQVLGENTVKLDPVQKYHSLLRVQAADIPTHRQFLTLTFKTYPDLCDLAEEMIRDAKAPNEFQLLFEYYQSIDRDTKTLTNPLLTALDFLSALDTRTHNPAEVLRHMVCAGALPNFEPDEGWQTQDCHHCISRMTEWRDLQRLGLLVENSVMPVCFYLKKNKLGLDSMPEIVQLTNTLKNALLLPCYPMHNV
ncbi:ORF10 [Ranid herpesvirus 2]|uniref:ORF10 n=1 Tax=Ranid herpesvirus 2 TaxID=389214 RepID=Q14W96_9VIRU|nr:ORF10 [Ranid herpesvirus 2]ABG25566.1 ORF10 [Ranid herpesvirus 2]